MAWQRVCVEVDCGAGLVSADKAACTAAATGSGHTAQKQQGACCCDHMAGAHAQQHPSSTEGGHLKVLEQLASNNEKTWLRLGEVAEEMGDFEQALDCYAHALVHNKDSPEALWRSAAITFEREQFDQAACFLQRLLNGNNTNGAAWCMLAHCNLYCGEHARAYTAYQQALYTVADPKAPGLWHGIALMFMACGDIERAAETFETILSSAPDYARAQEVRFLLSRLYCCQGKASDALGLLDKVREALPPPLTELDVLCQQAVVHELLGDFKSAEQAYTRVLEQRPDHGWALLRCGWMLQSRVVPARTDQALEMLVRAASLEGSDVMGSYLAGRCYMAAGNCSKAYECYKYAIFKDSRNATLWCSVGNLYYTIGEYQEALQAFGHAVRELSLVPADQRAARTASPAVETWYSLAALYDTCGQPEDAAKSYREVLALCPGHANAQKRLERLLSGHHAAAAAATSEPRLFDEDGTPLLLEPEVDLGQPPDPAPQPLSLTPRPDQPHTPPPVLPPCTRGLVLEPPPLPAYLRLLARRRQQAEASKQSAEICEALREAAVTHDKAGKQEQPQEQQEPQLRKEQKHENAAPQATDGHGSDEEQAAAAPGARSSTAK